VTNDTCDIVHLDEDGLFSIVVRHSFCQHAKVYSLYGLYRPMSLLAGGNQVHVALNEHAVPVSMRLLCII
jgi:hypothetical protein